MPASTAYSTEFTFGNQGVSPPTPLALSDRQSSMRSPGGISLVIPAWNEEHRLPASLDRYLPVLEGTRLPFEVIVVADGVSDKTVEVANLYSTRGVRILQFGSRLGKGGAILEGLRSAKYDYVGFLDADAPITAMDLLRLLRALDSSDCAIASRWVPGAPESRSQKATRIFLSKAWNALVRTILGIEVHDSQCGAKLFRKDAMFKVLPTVTLTSWAFDAALLFHLRAQGFRIDEVAVDWIANHDSKLRLEKAIPAMFLSLIGVRLMSATSTSRALSPWAHWIHQFLSVV